MTIDKYWLKEMIEYRPSPDLVFQHSVPPCQVYQELKERIRRVLDSDELGLFLVLTRLECLATILHLEKDVEKRYEDYWMVAKQIAKDILRKMEDDKDV